MLQLIKTIAVAIPFGFVVASIEPYPYSHDLQALVASATLFVLVESLLHRPDTKHIWLSYGLTTVACYAVPFLWFWWGAMSNGWWYPPQPPIVDHFFFVDGEAGYDAMVSNLFLVVWLVASVAFVIRHLTRRSRRRAASDARLS